MFRTQLERDDAAPVAARQPSQARILRRHFFRRFFDNDALSLEAETESSVIRALCAFAVPSLMVAFWLLPRYPNRDLWATAADRYFFVLYSFVSMGAVATFEWEMLFPDRADFLILLPLPLKERELFYAKAKALLSFLGLFLLAANLFALILFPAVSTTRTASYLHTAGAHFAAVSMAGIFAAFAVLAMGGIAHCVLPSSWFRVISPAIQALAITTLVLGMLLFPLISSHLNLLLVSDTTLSSRIAPLWFLGLYQYLQLGVAAPPGSARLAMLGLEATAIAAAVAIATYPLAWARQKKRALEGVSSSRRRRRLLGPVLQRTLLRRPQTAGLFHFISQTIARNNRYQVYLAIYAGVGLALTLAGVVTVQVTRSKSLVPALSSNGLHAILPLQLFWMVIGLKAAFAFPVDMKSRWVFPIALRPPEIYAGPYPGPDAKAARSWVLLCSAALTVATLALLLALHWSWWALAIQLTCGACLCLLLTDLFFIGRTQIPFTRPRLPGRTNLAIVFLMYLVVFPTLVIVTVHLEVQAESDPMELLWIALSALSAHAMLYALDQLAQRGIIGGFPEDEEDDGPQVLGLSQL